ncbi:NAD(P)-binding protein [Clavulina sp. PMI_390]|nr:NAD(P)-binding protein [Clavulina sp. PMI_390]
MDPPVTGEAAASRELVWFITGCSTGFGKLITFEVLKRGDKVIATNRGDLSRLDDLKQAGAHVMECDVTAPHDTMKEVARIAEGVYGRIDVVVNNAGTAKLGTLEELGPDGLLDQFKINFFGTASVNSAFLPYMRQRRSGTIVVTGSRSGLRIAPLLGAYGTSKAATNAYGETLAKEVAPFGIRVLTLIPGGFFTDGNTASPTLDTHHIDDYQALHDRMNAIMKVFPGSQPNDPTKYAPLLVDVVRGEGVMRDETKGGELRPWPERLVIGSDAVLDARRMFSSWEKSIEEYGDLARFADGDPAGRKPLNFHWANDNSKS